MLHSKIKREETYQKGIKYQTTKINGGNMLSKKIVSQKEF
jgi:hypothetical protein